MDPATIARLAPLPPEAAPAFAGMTYPAFRPLLLVPQPGRLAVGAWDADGRPAGLALAHGPEAAGEVEVVSLFVAAGRRGGGLATALLAALEADLPPDARRLTGSYVAGRPTTPALEAALARRGFAPPRPSQLLLGAELRRLADAPWARRAELDDDLAITPWSAVDAAARAALHAELASDPWVPQDLLPERHEAEPVDLATSLALWRGGRLAGWALNHRLDDHTLRFSAGWVRPELQRRGRLLALYARAGDLAMAAGLQRASWSVPFHHAAKVAFVRRWMAPYADRVDETRKAEKALEARA